MIGHTEIFIIAGVVLVLFGGAALPKFFRSIGKAKSEFEKGAREAQLTPEAEQGKLEEGKEESG